MSFDDRIQETFYFPADINNQSFRNELKNPEFLDCFARANFEADEGSDLINKIEQVSKLSNLYAAKVFSEDMQESAWFFGSSFANIEQSANKYFNAVQSTDNAQNKTATPTESQQFSQAFQALLPDKQAMLDAFHANDYEALKHLLPHSDVVEVKRVERYVKYIKKNELDPEFHLPRLYTVGSSSIGAIVNDYLQLADSSRDYEMTLSTAKEEHLLKAMIFMPLPPNDAMRRGTDFEDVIRDKLLTPKMQADGWNYEERIIRALSNHVMEEAPWIRVSLDTAYAKNNDIYILDIKVPAELHETVDFQYEMQVRSMAMVLNNLAQKHDIELGNVRTGIAQYDSKTHNVVITEVDMSPEKQQAAEDIMIKASTSFIENYLMTGQEPPQPDIPKTPSLSISDEQKELTQDLLKRAEGINAVIANLNNELSNIDAQIRETIGKSYGEDMLGKIPVKSSSFNITNKITVNPDGLSNLVALSGRPIEDFLKTRNQLDFEKTAGLLAEHGVTLEQLEDLKMTTYDNNKILDAAMETFGSAQGILENTLSMSASRSKVAKERAAELQERVSSVSTKVLSELDKPSEQQEAAYIPRPGVQ